MCGIFGFALKPGTEVSEPLFRSILTKLYLLSESRGKESAGLHLYLPEDGQAWTIKSAQPASKLLASQGMKTTLTEVLGRAYGASNEAPSQPVIAIAHSRLVTNGRAELSQNNQPVRWGKVTVIHNGIIVNIDQLWNEHSQLERHAEVDTEFLAAMISHTMEQNFHPILATRKTFGAIQGTASIAWVHGQASTLTAATNTGDLFWASLARGNGLVFASERFILTKALAANIPATTIHSLPAGSGLYLNLASQGEPAIFTLSGTELPSTATALQPHAMVTQHDRIEDQGGHFTPLIREADESLLRYSEASMQQLRRCSCCVLPETFPFIVFDEKGICNYCRNYKPKYRDLDAVLAKATFIDSLHKYRSKDGSPDVLVPFSGGRDSSYGLHLIKKEFGFNPITFTYDWGMVTDLARRNIARLCGNLGVQNILVSADIKIKRENIRKNVSAWLNKPDLGMVPLFMAGDKHFFKIVNLLKKQTGIRLDLWSANPLENTDFKSGFCGVSPDFDKYRVDHLSLGRKMRLAMYYLTRFFGNPGYLNSSLLDTAEAFLAYYIEPRRNFFFVFSHLVWNEEEVNNIIINNYDFELSPDSPSTWRIGDGTAPFYNYIYMTSSGFTEFDTFRSNQIREGQVTREEALASILIENRPRVESLRWYLDIIGLDFNKTIQTINTLDRLGLHT